MKWVVDCRGAVVLDRSPRIGVLDAVDEGGPVRWPRAVLLTADGSATVRLWCRVVLSIPAVIGWKRPFTAGPVGDG